jgi:diacylglycerol kinase
LPNDRVHFACGDMQRRSIERDYTWEGFINAFHHQKWFRRNCWLVQEDCPPDS